MSLDGYIAGPHGEFDWIVQDPAIDSGELLAQFDTYLVGRRPCEMGRRPATPPLPRGTTAYVFSRTLPDGVPGVSIVRDVSPAAMRAIKGRARKDIWLFGGGELFRSCLSLALVDR